MFILLLTESTNYKKSIGLKSGERTARTCFQNLAISKKKQMDILKLSSIRIFSKQARFNGGFDNI